MRSHKVDCFRRNVLGSHDQITFILAVFIIHQDDHFARANVINNFLRRADRHILFPVIHKFIIAAAIRLTFRLAMSTGFSAVCSQPLLSQLT